jgi:hypothetical protein
VAGSAARSAARAVDVAASSSRDTTLDSSSATVVRAATNSVTSAACTSPVTVRASRTAALRNPGSATPTAPTIHFSSPLRALVTSSRHTVSRAAKTQDGCIRIADSSGNGMRRRGRP